MSGGRLTAAVLTDPDGNRERFPVRAGRVQRLVFALTENRVMALPAVVPQSFEDRVNALLAAGWRVVPGTLAAGPVASMVLLEYDGPPEPAVPPVS